MKSVLSLSPHTNDLTGKNPFVTSTLSDIVTGLLDEIDTAFIRLAQCRLFTQTFVGAERMAAAT